MRYAIVALARADTKQVAAYFSSLVGNGLHVDYDAYAPRVWIVSYQGTPRQLTDLVWPDDTPRDERAIPIGLVIRIPDGGSINGLASRELWNLIQGN